MLSLKHIKTKFLKGESPTLRRNLTCVKKVGKCYNMSLVQLSCIYWLIHSNFFQVKDLLQEKQSCRMHISITWNRIKNHWHISVFVKLQSKYERKTVIFGRTLVFRIQNVFGLNMIKLVEDQLVWTRWLKKLVLIYCFE